MLRFITLGLLACTTVSGSASGPGPGPLDEGWNTFEHSERFELSREQLRARWQELHKRDLEPFPDADRIRAVATDLDIEPPAAPEAVAAVMQDAWRAYHAGRLHDAYRLADGQGPYGYYLAQRAWAAYTATLAPDDLELPLLREAVRRIDESPQRPSAVRHNDYWVQGLLLGQYSREISTGKAREEDIPGRVSRILEWTLEQRPEHAQAWINLGSYHAEIIHRVGWMLARMTYGATGRDALDAYRRGLELAPDMAVGYGEAAMGLHRIDARAYRQRILRYTEQLKNLEPLDAEDFLEKRRSLQLLGESP
jgi:hypothetical protein